MIYVYAITEPRADLPPIEALGAGIAEAMIGETVAAVFSRHDGPAISTTPQNLWMHESVVESLMRDRTLLPARFGTRFPDERRLEQALIENGDRLTRQLERVRGCVELGVRAIASTADASQDDDVCSPPPAAAATSGREYMMARLARERSRRQAQSRAQDLTERIDRELAPLSRERWSRLLPTSGRATGHLLSNAYLVERDRTAEFVERVRQVAAALPDMRLLCTGPWPPYHFADDLQRREAEHAGAR